MAGNKDGHSGQSTSQEIHRNGFITVGRRIGAGQNEALGTLQTGEGLPQNTPWQEVAVAEGSVAIQKHQIQIPGQFQVLVGIIQNNDIHIEFFQHHGADGESIAANGHRYMIQTAGHHKRLIAGLIGADQDFSAVADERTIIFGPAFIPAADHSRAIPETP